MKSCPKISDLATYFNDARDELDRHNLQEHLQSCARCKILLKNHIDIEIILKRVTPSITSIDQSKCFTEEDLVNYLESGTSRNAESDFTAHFIDCQSCVDRLVEIDTLMADVPKKSLIEIILKYLKQPSDILQKIFYFFENILKSFWSARPTYKWAGVLAAVVATVTFIVLFGNLSQTYLET
ncbi:MAG: hypothetical protein ACW98D_21565, partial [Promethearchaeota archaeon]